MAEKSNQKKKSGRVVGNTMAPPTRAAAGAEGPFRLKLRGPELPPDAMPVGGVHFSVGGVVTQFYTDRVAELATREEYEEARKAKLPTGYSWEGVDPEEDVSPEELAAPLRAERLNSNESPGDELTAAEWQARADAEEAREAEADDESESEK